MGELSNAGAYETELNDPVDPPLEPPELPWLTTGDEKLTADETVPVDPPELPLEAAKLRVHPP